MIDIHKMTLPEIKKEIKRKWGCSLELESGPSSMWGYFLQSAPGLPVEIRRYSRGGNTWSTDLDAAHAALRYLRKDGK